MTPQTSDEGEPRNVCTPCRGTGQVISNLGGERREVTCPWCGGSGRFISGRDAQESAAGQSVQTSGQVDQAAD